MNPCLPFAANLVQSSLRSNGFSKNIVLSPLSLNAIAAMLATGCSGRSLKRVLSFVGCDDLEQLKSMFSQMMSIATSSSSSSSPSSSACSGMSNSYRRYRGCGGSSSPPKISFVNGVWVDSRFPLKPSYKDCVTNVFKSDAKNVDFQKADKAIKEINSWADLQTNGLIKDVLQRGHISPVTALILGNALYFKGYWADEFDITRTRNQNFSLLGGDKVSVPFMGISRHYLYGSFDDFKVIELPYKSGNIGDKKRFSMQLILPHKIDGLQDLVLKFNSGFMSPHFELERTLVDVVRIPKIKFSSVLEEIKFPFMEQDMELTEMIHARDPPFISKIIHKAFIEVDEKGTEAAAVTFSAIEGCAPEAIQREIKTFVADHPFMFIVKEETSGLVLFVGAVVNPLPE
ncbi:serpin-ZXA-like [Coffea eugenioides]|uniref:serpin-ZXA-like n=1 Tax=Coffea eugenioides TaxID=49369 RepID=UPI000F604667|nr:serpin-ZXA-like [Coffea eugenioides]